MAAQKYKKKGNAQKIVRSGTLAQRGSLVPTAKDGVGVGSPPKVRTGKSWSFCYKEAELLKLSSKDFRICGH